MKKRTLILIGNLSALMLTIVMAAISASSQAVTLTIFWSAILCGSMPLMKDVIVEYMVLNKQEGENDE